MQVTPSPQTWIPATRRERNEVCLTQDQQPFITPPSFPVLCRGGGWQEWP